MIRFVFLVLLFNSCFCAQASVCDLQSDPLALRLINPKTAKWTKPVVVDWQLDRKTLNVDFTVSVPVQNEKKVFTPKDYPFQYDVVEIFLAVGDPSLKNFSYYEFELTPNGQTFDVQINVNAGVKKFINNIDVGVETLGSSDDKTWNGSFKIPLDKLGWTGNPAWVRGNLFAIIGKKGERTYWSAYLPKQTKVNFHLPDYFKPLFTCN